MPKISSKILAAIVGISALLFMGGGSIFPFISLGQSPGIALSSPAKNLKKGDSFSVTISIDPDGVPIETARVAIAFPTDLVEITAFTQGTMFPNKSSLSGYNNSGGAFSWGEYTDEEGVTKAGVFGVMTFNALRDGLARIQVTSASHLVSGGEEKIVTFGSVTVSIGQGGVRPAESPVAVPLPDSQGQEPPITVVTEDASRLEQPPSFDEGEVTGTPPAPSVASKTHPDPAQWYSNNDPEFTVEPFAGTTDINVVADKYPRTDPGTLPDPLRKVYIYNDVADGTWYFHAKLRNAAGWGATTHTMFQIDTTPPSELEITRINEDLDQATFALSAQDELSGIDHYVVSIDNGEWQKWRGSVDGTYTTATLDPGVHSIMVQALDKAGNKKELAQSFEIATYPSIFTPLTTPISQILTTDYWRYWYIILIEFLWILGELLAFWISLKILHGMRAPKKERNKFMTLLARIKNSKKKTPPRRLTWFR